MTKILIVSTYPIKNAQHGGQRRVAAIVKGYKKRFKKVKFVAVYSPDYYRHHGPDDIAVKRNIREEIKNSPFTGDVICGNAIYGDPYTKKKMIEILKSFKPDIIQIEQVFPYLGLKPLLEDMKFYPKIVLSSHNIEYSHKKSILDNSSFSHQSDKVTKLIKECEENLAREADSVVAVSEDDAIALKKMGAKKVVVAPNGIAQKSATAKDKSYWQAFKARHKLSKVAVFVGSAHPPNWHGFEVMVGDRLGFLPRDKKIIFAGSISDYFVDNYKGLRPEYVTFWLRAYAAGRVSDESLAGLIDEADVILLPITEGGGSNLKTAEAILSGKKIVATSYAFRSFEAYLGLPNIFIADSPTDFKDAILRAFEAKYVVRTAEQVELAAKVQWQHCLTPMVEEVSLL